MNYSQPEVRQNIRMIFLRTKSSERRGRQKPEPYLNPTTMRYERWVIQGAMDRALDRNLSGLEGSMPPNSLLQGFDYQARYFWNEAARLLYSDNVQRVGYELDQFKSFDDVALVYHKPLVGERGETILEDYFQVKFHTDHTNALTWEQLLEPALIGATTYSVLYRLHEAVKKVGDVSKVRFHLVSPWPIDHNNLLSRLVTNNGGELKLNEVFKGGDKSECGKMRTKLREHMKLSSDEELRTILTPFRIVVAPNMKQLLKNMNLSLQLAGLAPVDETKATCGYDDLIKKEYQAGKRWFDLHAMKDLCKRENLFQSAPGKSQKQDVGVRSFYRFAEHLEDSCNHFLCLIKHFEDRLVKDQTLWNGAIYEEIEAFSKTLPHNKGEVQIRFDAHLSIALLTGYFVDLKFPQEISLVQTGKIWNRKDQLSADESKWKIEDSGNGDTFAISISITHDIFGEAKNYMADSGTVSFKNFRLQGGTSQTGVVNGAHAFVLAESIIAEIKKMNDS